jgi:hypothetical protein
MAGLTVRLQDGTPVAMDDKPVGMGAEKMVFLSCDRKLAVYFYRNRPHIVADRAGRETRLHAVLGKFNPTLNSPASDFWCSHFCWPTAMLDKNQNLPDEFFAPRATAPEGLLKPVFGFVAPIYPENFFFTDIRKKRKEKKPAWFIKPTVRQRNVPPEEQGNLRHYLMVCAKIARGLRRLHQSGLAHGDISFNNVLVDPKNAQALIIDLDGLVVPMVAPPVLMGTPGYIAPEVVARRKTKDGTAYEPNRLTDLYSVAVLFYELLLNRHPLLDGRKVVGESAEELEHLKLGPEALFVEHPTDKSNSLNPPPVVTIGKLGPFLEKLFLKTFVDGLENPLRRADAAEWENAFYATLDLLHPSPAGKDWTVLVPGQPMRCMFSHQPIAWSVPIGAFIKVDQQGHERATDRRLVLYQGLELYDWHRFNGMAPDESLPRPFKARAQVLFDKPNRAWKIKNLADQPFLVKGEGTQANGRVEPGQDITLQKGLKLQLAEKGPTTHQSPRLVAFDFQNP